METERIISVERYYDTATKRFVVEAVKKVEAHKKVARRAFQSVEDAEDYAVALEVMKKYS